MHNGVKLILEQFEVSILSDSFWALFPVVASYCCDAPYAMGQEISRVRNGTMVCIACI